MGRMSPHAPISSASRRRLAGWLVGSSLGDAERNLFLETLSHTHGRRRRACLAHQCGLCGTRSSQRGVCVPRHESHDEILSRMRLPDQCLHSAEADVRPPRRKSGFDSTPT